MKTRLKPPGSSSTKPTTGSSRNTARSRSGPTPPPSVAIPTCVAVVAGALRRGKAPATKATIFSERTVQARRPIPEVKNAQDALLVTLGERGAVDLDYLGDLLHQRPAEFLAGLKGAIFLNPQNHRWETEDEYLSGNVRAKLAVAEAAALADEQFMGNVEALRLVQPADLAASEIDARLGSTWIPREDIRQFAEELLGKAVSVLVTRPNLVSGWCKAVAEFGSVSPIRPNGAPTGAALWNCWRTRSICALRPFMITIWTPTATSSTARHRSRSRQAGKDQGPVQGLDLGER